MALTVHNRPLVPAKPPAARVAAKPPVQSAPAAAASVPMAAAAFTPPVIVDILFQSFKGGFGLVNLAWMVGPTAFRNIRDVAKDKISLARGAANVVTDSSINIGRGIAAAASVQILQVAAAPMLGLIPAAALPFASIGIAIGGLVGTYWLLGKAVKASGLDTKMSNALTKLLGGDKPAPAAE